MTDERFAAIKEELNLMHEVSTLYENLTETQERCKKLLEENRALKKHIKKVEKRWISLLLQDEFAEACPALGDKT